MTSSLRLLTSWARLFLVLIVGSFFGAWVERKDPLIGELSRDFDILLGSAAVILAVGFLALPLGRQTLTAPPRARTGSKSGPSTSGYRDRNYPSRRAPGSLLLVLSAIFVANGVLIALKLLSKRADAGDVVFVAWILLVAAAFLDLAEARRRTFRTSAAGLRSAYVITGWVIALIIAVVLIPVGMSRVHSHARCVDTHGLAACRANPSLR